MTDSREALRLKRLAATHERKAAEWADSIAPWATPNMRLHQDAMSMAIRDRFLLIRAYLDSRTRRLPPAISLPRKWDRYDYRDRPATIYGGAFTISPAAYASNRYTISTRGHRGSKSRACRLAGAVTRQAYTNRSRGYQASPAQAERFYALYVAGWDASIFGDLEAPR